MISSKVVTLIAQLSKTEQNRLRKLVVSPWFNEQEDVILLYDLIVRHLRNPEKAEKLLQKEKIWTALYPKRKYDDVQLRRISAELTKLVMQFITEEARGMHDIEDALLLQKALNKPGFQKHLPAADRNIQQKIHALSGKSPEYYLAQFQMYWNLFLRATKSGSTNGLMENLIPASTALDQFYMTQKLLIYSSSLIYKKLRVTEHEIALLPGFEQNIDHELFKDVPLVVLYKQVTLCLLYPEEEAHFQALLAALEKHGHELTRNDLREGYQAAQNYCAFKINQGNSTYYRVYFDLFKRIIELDLLLDDAPLPEGVFKNIITISLGVGEYAWAENFIQQYAAYLPPPIRENARSYNLAHVYFYLKKYDKVIELLRNVEYSDVVYALGSKNILLRTYYESDEWMALDSLIDSFRIYIQRNKLISKDLKREYINFINFLKKLGSLSTASSASIAVFKKKVQETRNLTSKKWLLEKIRELE
jgi:hypothetical protein